MTCDQVQPLLVDDRERARPSVSGHLASCPACRALASADASARALSAIDPVPPLLPVDASAALARRRALRAAWVTSALGAGMVVAAAVLAWTRPAPDPIAVETQPAAAENAPLLVAPQPEVADPAAPGAEAEPSFPFELLADTREWLERDPSRGSLYASFGALPQWVSLPRDAALDPFPFEDPQEVTP